jgi:hypothetical protein
MASVPLTKPTKCLLFRSPLPKGEGIKQALEWNREQLLDLRRLWELRRQRRVDLGLIPMTHPPHQISDAALGVENRTSIATATPPSSQTPHSTSLLTPLESQCRDLFRPTAWRDLTSVVRRPRRWQLTSPPGLGKTTKMPLRFRQSVTTEKSSRGSSPKASASQPRPLPKGWVYAVEEVDAEVKAEVTDPTLYQTMNVPVTRSRLRHAEMLTDPHRRLRRALSITEGRRTFPSVSELTPARYIRAHLDAPNPFVEGRLSLNGPTYHSEIHAAPIVDVDVAPPPISADILRLLDTDYMGHDNVDEAIGEIGDRSLRAEVNRYRRLERKRRSFQESIRRLEDQMFTTDVERQMCVSRLESARAMVRIQAEMQSNRQAFRLSPWSLERGRLP